ncbi:MAG: hypothetical protein JSR48_02930 [Verrucomicrobia bacterium]|nr:hypothetical protein [Verrucomicrobiota bacterium]
MTRRSTEHLVCLGLFAVCVLLNLSMSAVGLRHSLQEIHGFRQIQTALTTQRLEAEGFQLAYPTPLFGPPWSAPMEFPLYQVCVATLAKATGWPLEPVGRVVSLAFLYAALPAVLGLAELLGLSPARRWLAGGLVLLSPVYLYYSRSFMIESTALCAALWFLYAYVRGLAPRAYGWLAAAAVFCAVGALAKVTTLMVFLAAGAIYTLARLTADLRSGQRVGEVLATGLRGLAATIPGVAVGYAWVRYSDAIKVSNPLSAFLASGPMQEFNFGSLAQRFSGDFWVRIMQRTTESVTPSFAIALVLVFALLLGGVRRRALLLVAGFLAGPLIFANLYFVHDYYFYACGVFLLGAVALAWNQLLDLPGYSSAAKWSVVIATLILQFGTYAAAYFPSQYRSNRSRPPELATALAAATEPNDVILVFGEDWSSEIAYYSRRRTVMVVDALIANTDALEQVLRRMPPDQVTAIVVTGRMRGYPGFFKPLIDRLRLQPTAALVSPETVVYLAERRITALRSRLKELPLEAFHFALSEESVAGIPRIRYVVSQLPDRRTTDMMTPRPVSILHPFTPGAYELDGKNVFSAHAPTDLLFEIPRGARTIDAEYGIFPTAYTGGNATEGVEFRIELFSPDGAHQTLYSAYLSPSKVPADRGNKTLHVTLPEKAAGHLTFRTLPGPTNSIACAWAYWGRIAIQ